MKKGLGVLLLLLFLAVFFPKIVLACDEIAFEGDRIAGTNFNIKANHVKPDGVEYYIIASKDGKEVRRWTQKSQTALDLIALPPTKRGWLMLAGARLDNIGDYSIQIVENSGAASPDSCTGSVRIVGTQASCPTGDVKIKDVYGTTLAKCSAEDRDNLETLCCKPSGTGACVDNSGSTMIPNSSLTCSDLKSRLTQYTMGCTDPNNDKYVPKYGCVNSRSGTVQIWAGIPYTTCSGGVEGLDTAIGCVPTSKVENFSAFILKFVFGAAGGLILIMFIITSYNILTSAGNPEKLQASKENLISIFSGIILIGFSLVLLKAIGFNILGLPGF